MVDDAQDTDRWANMMDPLKAGEELRFDRPKLNSRENTTQLPNSAAKRRSLRSHDTTKAAWDEPNSPIRCSSETDIAICQAQLAVIIQPRGIDIPQPKLQRTVAQFQHGSPQILDHIRSHSENCEIESSLLYHTHGSMNDILEDSALEISIAGDIQSSLFTDDIALNHTYKTPRSGTVPPCNGLPRKIKNWYMSDQERLVVDISSRCPSDKTCVSFRAHPSDPDSMKLVEDSYLDEYHTFLKQRCSSILNEDAEKELDSLDMPDEDAIKAVLKSIGYNPTGV